MHFPGLSCDSCDGAKILDRPVLLTSYQYTTRIISNKDNSASYIKLILFSAGGLLKSTQESSLSSLSAQPGAKNWVYANSHTNAGVCLNMQAWHGRPIWFPNKTFIAFKRSCMWYAGGSHSPTQGCPEWVCNVLAIELFVCSCDFGPCASIKYFSVAILGEIGNIPNPRRYTPKTSPVK